MVGKKKTKGKEQGDFDNLLTSDTSARRFQKPEISKAKASAKTPQKKTLKTQTKRVAVPNKSNSTNKNPDKSSAGGTILLIQKAFQGLLPLVLGAVAVPVFLNFMGRFENSSDKFDTWNDIETTRAVRVITNARITNMRKVRMYYDQVNNHFKLYSQWLFDFKQRQRRIMDHFQVDFKRLILKNKDFLVEMHLKHDNMAAHVKSMKELVER